MDIKKGHNIKRIFLITVDCLRADHVGCIGGGNLTPNIDRLAKDSILFTRAFANGPGTNQSFPAIFTSTYFLMHDGLRLMPRYTTLAEVMRENGFKTVAFHSNPFLSKVLGWDRGFDEFYDFLEDIKSPSAAVTREGLVRRIMGIFAQGRIGYSRRLQSLLKRIYYRFTGYQVPYLEARMLNERVIEWLVRNRDGRFLLWMHYMDPHTPLIPPEPYLIDFSSRSEAFEFNVNLDTSNLSEEQVYRLKNLYVGEVKYVDESIGDLVSFLEDEGFLEDSLLLVMADHGHAFMEHQKFGHNPEILYNEVLHVPLLMHGLDVTGMVDAPVQLLNVSPTILDILDFEKPESFLGGSLMQIIDGVGERVPIFSESARPDLMNLRYDTSKKVVSCIRGNVKFIHNEVRGTEELYDLERDFQEKDNLFGSEKELHAELASLVENHLLFEDSCRVKIESKSAGDKIKQRLKSLGYI